LNKEKRISMKRIWTAQRFNQSNP